MSRFLWRFLMWRWTRKAKRSCGGPSRLGELFNTQAFQAAAGTTIGCCPSTSTAEEWLRQAGWKPGVGAWFASTEAAERALACFRREKGCND